MQRPTRLLIYPSNIRHQRRKAPLFRELSAELRRQAKEAVEAEASATAEQIKAGAEEIEQKRLEAERLFEAWREPVPKDAGGSSCGF